MGKPFNSQDPDPDVNTPTDSTTAWFAVLERARLTDEYALAERATRELDRLGVEVRFHRRVTKGGAGRV